MEEFCKNHLANLIASNPEIYFRVTNHLRSFIDEEDLSAFKGTDNEIKKKLLKHLNYVGGISSHVYEMELEDLE